MIHKVLVPQAKRRIIHLPPGLGSKKTSKEPQGIVDMRLKSAKDKKFPPLVVCGPTCSGKVSGCCD